MAESAQTAVNRQAMAHMRILVQQKQTGLYFKDIGSWVEKSSEALDFINSTAAIDFCVANKLKDVQLVLKFDEQQYDIVMPVQAAAEVRTRQGGSSR